MQYLIAELLTYGSHNTCYLQTACVLPSQPLPLFVARWCWIDSHSIYCHYIHFLAQLAKLIVLPVSVCVWVCVNQTAPHTFPLDTPTQDSFPQTALDISSAFFPWNPTGKILQKTFFLTFHFPTILPLLLPAECLGRHNTVRLLQVRGCTFWKLRRCVTMVSSHWLHSTTASDCVRVCVTACPSCGCFVASRSLGPRVCVSMCVTLWLASCREFQSIARDNVCVQWR